MDGPRDYHTKQRKSGKEKHMTSLLCGVSNMTQINLCAKRNSSQTENSLVVHKGRTVRGMERKSGTQTSREWVSSHRAQGIMSIVSHNGKEYD